MSLAATKRLDCRGMQCPTPILHIATAARTAGSAPTVLEVLVDDRDFPKDVEAWCRTSRSELIGMEESGGVIRARIGLNGAGAPGRSGEIRRVVPQSTNPQSAPTPANQLVDARRTAPQREPSSQVHRLDCRGMRCPAPILELSKFARRLKDTPGVIEVTADDSEFPSDLKAWCKTTRSQLLDLSEGPDGITARLALASSAAQRSGSSRDAVAKPVTQPRASAPLQTAPVADASRPMPAAPPAASAPARMRPAPASLQPAAPPMASVEPAPSRPPNASILDLRGLRAPQPVLRLSALLSNPPGASVTVHADDAGFLTDVMAWASATKATVRSASQEGGTTTVVLKLPATGSEVLQEPAALQPEPAVSPSTLAALARDTVPTDMVPVQVELPAQQESTQQDRCTILVIRNDFESLMAAMLCATTAAAQGLEAVMYFSFWGVNMLRGEKPRPREGRSRASFLQKIMKWMMPKGPKRQKMSKMHMGGMGKGMMQYFMRKNNVMSLEQMIDSAVKQDVRFVVCSMSMGIMGIEKRDLMDLPNIEYAGVTSFVELSQRSKSTLVF